MRHDLQLVRDDVLEISALFARVCANSRDPGVASMRSIYRTIALMILPSIDSGAVLAAGERETVRLALGRLRERRIALDYDLTEARLRLDARLVMLERHIKEVLDLDAVFAASRAKEATHESHDQV